MKIQKIYDKYKIMPQLQLHQLRVAGVASIICDDFQKTIDKDSVVTAALLHDMGNIVKFKLELFPEHLKPKGLNHWQKVKKEFIDEYGKDDHITSNKIAKEIGVNNKVLKIITAFGFREAKTTIKYTDFERKIAPYSDMRVGMNGIQVLDERIDGGIKRYSKSRRKSLDKVTLLDLKNIWELIEEQIFYHTDISPDEITDRGVMRLIPKLREYEIKTN